MTDTFVREAMLPPELPPASQRGAVKWMRENLFSSITNGILTVLGVLVVCSIAAVLLRLQPIGAKPGLVNMLAGLTIGRGLRLFSRFRMSGNKPTLTPVRFSTQRAQRQRTRRAPR